MVAGTERVREVCWQVAYLEFQQLAWPLEQGAYLLIFKIILKTRYCCYDFQARTRLRNCKLSAQCYTASWHCNMIEKPRRYDSKAS